MGNLTAVAAGVSPEMPLGSGRLELDLRAEVAVFEDRTHASGRADLRGTLPFGGGAWTLEAAISAGAVGGDAPLQSLWYLGGRGTLPGHPFRSFAGEAFGLGSWRVSRALVAPWLDLSATFGGGRSAGGRRSVLEELGIGGTGGWRGYAGGGVALLGGAVRVDYFRALGRAGDEWVISLDPRLPGL